MQIIKVPGINAFGRTKGCRNAGNSVLEELKNVFSSEKGKIIQPDLLDLEEIHVNNDNIEEQESLIYKNSLKAFHEQEKIAFLGGDHSISCPIVRAFLEFCSEQNKEPCLIVFDAHPDCMPPAKNPTHEEWLRAAVERGFPEKNILLVGARNSDKREIEFLSENKIKQISINQINSEIDETTDTIMEFASGKELYVSFDIDVIDPAFAPSTGYKEPGGLTSRQAIYTVSRISMMKNLRAFDIVEINSDEDTKKGSATVKLGAKLLAELL
jgi:agmatinase